MPLLALSHKADTHMLHSNRAFVECRPWVQVKQGPGSTRLGAEDDAKNRLPSAPHSRAGSSDDLQHCHGRGKRTSACALPCLVSPVAESQDPQTLLRGRALQQGGTEATGDCLYTVKSQDSMWGIAVQRGMTLQQLRRLNPQVRSPEVIQPGEVIRVC
jgi:hypothetical protein